MKLINNQLYVNLDNFLNLDKFNSLHEDITVNMAMSEEYIVPGSAPTRSILNKQTMQSYQDIKNTAKSLYPDLSSRQLDWYSLLKGSEYHGYTLYLKNIKRYPYDFSFKGRDSSCYYTTASKNFKFLFDWIDEQQCFDEYGRVLFFINYPGQTGMIHKDNVGIEHVKDQFIWITNNKFPKSIFLYNEDLNEKIYLNNQSVFFDNQNYHGTENKNTAATWSLRIDGVFNYSWAKNAGIL
jgi:hypothetical protein